jgi:hypothetical protein
MKLQSSNIGDQGSLFPEFLLEGRDESANGCKLPTLAQHIVTFSRDWATLGCDIEFSIQIATALNII